MVIPPAEGPTLRGRRGEQAALSSLILAVLRSRGGALVLHGDPGIGTTALLEHARREAAAEGCLVLGLSGRAAEAGLPLAGLHQVLSDRQDLEGFDLLRLSLHVLQDLAALARDRPVVCLIDGADRVDRPSLDVLAFCAVRTAQAPIAWVFTTRGTPVEPIDDLPRLPVGELDAASTMLLLRDHGVTGDVAAALCEISGGNPQAIIELAGSLSPAQRAGEAWPPRCLGRGSPLRLAHLRRLDRLPASTRRLLVIIAADDRLAEDELLRGIAAEGLQLSDCEPAEAAGMVSFGEARVNLSPSILRSIVYTTATLAERRRAHRLLACCVEAGRHPLRSALHRALAAAGPDDDLAAQLDACSDQHSGDPMLAARALCRAAELTSDSDLAAQRRIGGARYAWLAGRPHQARLLLHAGGGSGAAQRLPIPALILDGEIELRAGDAIAACDLLLSAVHQAPDADRSLRLAGLTMVAETVFHTGQERLFPELARQAAALRHPGESPEEEMIFEYFAGMGILFSLDRSGALPHLNRAMALASELDDCRGLLRGSLVGLLLGDDPLALRMASRARTLAASSGQAALIPQAGLLAGLALFARGRYGDATVLLMESQRLAERSGLEVLVSEHLGVLATLAAIEGDHQLARARLDLLRERGQGQAQCGASMAARWTLAILDLLFGDPVDATRQLLQVVGGDAISGNVVIRMAATPYLVEAATLSGAREVARQALGQFDGWATRTDNPVWLAFSARGHALVAEDEDEAEESFERARHYHLRAGSDFELARTALLRGRRLRDGHRLAAAEQSIALANEIFDRLGARVWAEWAAEDRASIAAKLAAEPGAGRGAGCPVEELLTAQELRIARMAAQGATNREIAAELFLSTRTVEYHLYKTFAKLGVRSRVELAGLVV